MIKIPDGKSMDKKYLLKFLNIQSSGSFNKIFFVTFPSVLFFGSKEIMLNNVKHKLSVLKTRFRKQKTVMKIGEKFDENFRNKKNYKKNLCWKIL